MGYDTLKLNYFFWDMADGRKQNFTFSGDVVPFLKRDGFKVHTQRPENLK